MRKFHLIALAAILIMMIAGSGCKRDMYDEDITKKLMDSVMPVDSIDPNHTWTLTQTKNLMVTTPDTGAIKMVRILTANPRETGDAEVAGEAYASSGETVTMSVTFSNRLKTLYAAAVDSMGFYTLTSFEPDGSSLVDFEDPIFVHEVLPYDPEPQQYTYCYERQYDLHLVYDFDYNDVVMRISQERTDEKEMRYYVQLAAVGLNIQMAGAINLVGFKYDDIESVTTVDSLSFNTTNGKDVPDQILTVATDKSFLLKGLTNEAVLNLFVDAHWATGDLLEEDFGMMKRKYYNVSKASSGNFQLMVPRTITYIVKFKSADGLNMASIDRLDPFIYYGFNGANFEIHLFQYRNNQTLNSYPSSNLKTLPWALCIPFKTFRWPLEEVNIGFIKDGGHTFGAYPNMPHSFGEWSMDRTRATDWYEYPQENQVF
ncbi:MAG: DUF4842 domain-containing protein [Prevotella sp.]|nr:DUF4842 domain-containing protein [Prevotella sp.]